MTIIKNNIEIAKIYRGINSIGKAYVGDKLVFGGGVTPTPASSVLVYNEASPSKLTLKAGTYKATVFNFETGEETVQDYVLTADTDIETYDKPYTYLDMSNNTTADKVYNSNHNPPHISTINKPPIGECRIGIVGVYNYSYSTLYET